MKKLLLVSLAVAGLISGCTSAGAPAITVSVTSSAATVQAGGMLQITATVANDSANKGVAWSVTCSAAACGNVSPTSTASGAATTYTAPANPPASDVTVTITATSVADGTKVGTTTITFKAVTISVAPGGLVGIQGGTTKQFTATVMNTSNTGVTWTLTQGGTACSPGCGTLSSSTANPVTYTAPGPPASNLTVTITAKSAADNTKTSSATIIVLAITVSVAPPTANVPVKGMQQYTATVGNDAANKGVTWALTQGGTACSPGCGTIAPTATLSGSPTTYTAPATVPSPATVTITATSVADTSKSGTATATVLAIIVTISPTSASVVINATQQFIGTVANDVSNSGVDWTLTQSGTPCSPTCGTITAHTASGSPATYTAPASVPTPTTVTVTATATADPSKSAPATVTVTAAPPISVSVSPPSASVAVSGTQQFTATVTNTANTAVTWTLTQSGTACSPMCGTLNNATANPVTYTAPAAVPTPATVTVTATSVADNTKSGSATITVTSGAAACPLPAGGSEALFSGSYAALFSGWSDTKGKFGAVASFTANGSSGTITGGHADTNGVGQTPSANQSFTGCYTLSVVSGTTEARGKMIWNFTGANWNGTNTVTFAVVLRSDGKRGNFIEFDDTNGTSGTRGSGDFRLQDTTLFTASFLTGPFGFATAGADGNGNRTGIIGVLTGDGVSAISNGGLDFSTKGSSSSNNGCFSGSFTAPDPTSGRGTITLMINITINGVPTAITEHFAYYIEKAGQAFIQSTDAPNTTGQLLLTGFVLPQTVPAGGFTVANSFNARAIFSLTGFDESHNGTHTDIGMITSPGNGTFTGVLDENSDAVPPNMATNVPISGTITIPASTCAGANGLEVVSITNPAGLTPTSVVVLAPNTAFLLEGIPSSPGNDAEIGFAQPQKSTTALGSFIFGSDEPGSTSVAVQSGVVTVTTGPNVVTGTSDQSGISGLSPGGSISGTFTIDLSLGRGVITPTGGGSQMIFWVIKGSEVVVMDTSQQVGTQNVTILSLHQ